jgi:7 transmembrane helices usually fused to an inactive transglutaminase
VYTLGWDEKLLVGASYEYTILGPNGEKTEGILSDFSILRDGKVVESVRAKEKYVRYFTNPWKVDLEARFALPNGCIQTIKKSLQVYSRSLVVVGDMSLNFSSESLSALLSTNNVLLIQKTYQWKLGESTTAPDIWNTIEKSSIVVVSARDTLEFFSEAAKLQRAKQVDFGAKEIYIISDYSKAFLSKVIAAPLSKLGAKRAYLISEADLYGLAASLSIGTDTTSLKSIQWQELSYEKNDRVYSLDGLLGMLAYSGFSYELIGFLLATCVAIIILNFLKQVVGFNVFGIYYPLLFAITIAVLGFSGALVFLVTGFFSIYLINMFSKRFHLLLHAKRSLLLWTYVFLLLLALGVDNFFEFHLVQYSVFENALIVFPLLITVILAEKIFQEDINLFERTGFFDVMQYAAIIFVAYIAIENQTIRYFLISYPDSIIVFILGNIAIGRYTWLQLVEYVRFMPLLRRLDTEEE